VVASFASTGWTISVRFVRHVVVTPTAELHLKSRRTRRRMIDTLRRNLRETLRAVAPLAVLGQGPGERLRVDGPDDALAVACEVAAHTFGVQTVQLVTDVPCGSLDELVSAVAAHARSRVAGHTFAARVRRVGEHDWRSMDAERAIGTALLPGSAGVDLRNPEVTVRTLVYDDHAIYVEREVDCVGGFPLGVHAPLLTLLSGGIDSPVAAWSVMRRGSPVDFVHCELECAQTEHTLAVAYDLWKRWGAGTSPVVWVLDFSAVEAWLRAHVDGRWRQVALKWVMITEANRIARETRHVALVMGDAIGQVSSQTVSNIAALERVHDAVVLRPLITMSKNEIIERARAIGSYELSSRAQEVCNLTDGPVETAANVGRLRTVVEAIPDDVRAAPRRVVSLAEWSPAMPLPSVCSGSTLPGSSVFSGPDAIIRASKASALGQPTAVLLDSPA
jgi:tRNA uracil 4-sulfurtransferase